MAVLQDLSQAELIARLQAAEARCAALAQAKQGKLTCKVSEKGALSVYGFGRWPVTLYKSQWARLFDGAEQIKAALRAFDSQLSEKGD